MIGFYVHHHGTGHLSHAQTLIAALGVPAAVLTSLDVDSGRFPAGTEIIRLPADHDASDAPSDARARGALHWAPVGTQLLKPRTRRLVEWLTRPDAELLVVDMSVEVLLQGRLCGVPTVAVRLAGERTDRAHRLGYDTASGLLAPFPAELEDTDTPKSIRDRTFYGGLYSKESDRVLSKSAARLHAGLSATDKVIVICVGSGGNSMNHSHLAELAASMPGWKIRVVGATGDTLCDGQVEFAGWVDDPFKWMRAADVVVANTSANLVAEVAAADRPLIGIAEDRPYDEQYRRARRLSATGAAIAASRWPQPDQWPRLVDQTLRLGTSVLHQWSKQGSASAVTQWLGDIAASYRARAS